jgi:hypothetical protein
MFGNLLNTSVFVGYKRQIIMTTENDPVLIQSTSQLAEKYPDNTTIVHMDKNGNYKVVHGLKLDEIPKGDLKVIFCCHNNLAFVSYKWICNVALLYFSYIPFLKFSLGLLSHLNLIFSYG